MKKINANTVEDSMLALFKELGRPVHLGDIKTDFGVLTKRDSQRKCNTDSDTISRTIQFLFKKGRIAKSEKDVLVRNYPSSPYATVKKENAPHVRFCAPIEYAGKNIRFELNGIGYDLRFVDCKEPKEDGVTKKELVRRILEESDRGLTSNEIAELMAEKHGAYDVSNKNKLYNAASSIKKFALQKLMRAGLKYSKFNGIYVWFFTQKQLENYQRFYVDNDPILKGAEEVLRNEKCISSSKLASILQISSTDLKYRLERDGTRIYVGVQHKSTLKERIVNLEVKQPKRRGKIPWLGVVISRGEYKNSNYETMYVHLDTDWEEELKKQIEKSIETIPLKALVGLFYEKYVAKVFNTICTSREIQEDPELSQYMIPFVFRSDRIVNIWTTLDTGRRAEFDVVIRGTFKPFDVMAGGRTFLDLAIVIESKYSVVTPPHVIQFDEKIRRTFGENRWNILPMIVGLSWSGETLTLAQRLGIIPLYFSAINKLVSKLTGTDYNFRQEWKRIEDRLESGELSLENLRALIKDMELKYEFEELLEKRLGKPLTTQLTNHVETENESKKKILCREIKKENTIEPMLATSANDLSDILSKHPLYAWEYKLNGIRLIAEATEKGVRLYTRNSKDLSERFPEIVKLVSESVDVKDFVLDGELIAVDDREKPLPPQRITELINRNNPLPYDFQLRYVLFDILRLNGDDTTSYSLEERRQLLQNHVKQNNCIGIVPRIASSDRTEIEEFFQKAKALGHEGLVAKAIDSPYTPGARNECWFKYKGEPDTIDAVVVGITWGKGWKKGTIGSVLLAEKRNGKFYTIGKVGSGLRYYQAKKLHEELKPFVTKEMPAEIVSNDNPDLWVKPCVMVEVAYEGQSKSRKYTAGYSLKFPRFVRIREDKTVVW